MSRFFPHADYAEDQPLARTILTTHVLYRGIQTGAVVGLATGSAANLYRFLRADSVQRATMKSGHSVSALKGVIPPTISQTLFRHAGVGGVVGLAAVSVGLPFMMHGREEIEWNDRSWRLMQNKGQLEVDDFSLVGSVAGLASSFARKGNGGLTQLVGRTATGSVVGILAYLGFRYGIMRGKRSEQSVRRIETPAAAVI